MRALACILALSACEKVQTLGVQDLSFAVQESWLTVDAPKVDYYAVSGSGPSDVVIVGAGGTILRWNGMALTQETSGTTSDLRGVIAVSPMLAYAVGQNGTILRWDGVSWKSEMLPPPPPVDLGVIPDGSVPDLGAAPPPFLNAVWADATTAVAVGEGAAGFVRMGSTWQRLSADGEEDLFAVTSVGGQVIATGTLGTVMTLSGTNFTRTPVPPPTTIAGITTGPDGTFLVGLSGKLLTYPGGTPVTTLLPASFARSAVEMPGSTLFVVGWDNLIARVKLKPTVDVFVYPQATSEGHWYYGAWADAMGELWIVGTTGAILRGPPSIDPAVPDGGMHDGGMPD